VGVLHVRGDAAPGLVGDGYRGGEARMEERAGESFSPTQTGWGEGGSVGGW